MDGRVAKSVSREANSRVELINYPSPPPSFTRTEYDYRKVPSLYQAVRFYGMPRYICLSQPAGL